MSNVVSAITANDTGDRRIKSMKSKLFQDVFSVKEDIQSMTSYGDVLKRYRIGVTIGSQCEVSEFDEVRANTGVSPLHEAIGRTKRQVIEAIFGEFRQDFRIIERHLYNYDFEEAATGLREMETKMYSED